MKLFYEFLQVAIGHMNAVGGSAAISTLEKAGLIHYHTGLITSCIQMN